MFKKLLKVVAVSAVTAFMGLTSANAALVNTPVPTNAYITMGGLDWAWANPLPSSSPTFDLAFQSGFGWRLPTAAELLGAPLATDFLFAGANVPLGGSDPVSGAVFQATNAGLTGDGACASPYFSNTYRHCDWQDGLGQPLGPWAGMAGAPSFADQLVVRFAGGQAVPAPGVMGLMLLGLLGMGYTAIRRRVAA